MIDLKNDTDELMRDAAEHYPLKLPEDGWNGLAARLSAVQAIPGVQTKRNQNGKWFLSLLILLFLATAAITATQLLKNDSSVKGPSKLITASPVSINRVSNKSNIHISGIDENGLNLSATDFSVSPIKKTEVNRFNSYEASRVNDSRTYEPLRFDNNIVSIGPGDFPVIPDLIETNASVQEPLIKSFTDQRNEFDDPSAKMGNSANTGFYFGIAGGPAMSRVRDDGFHKTGYEAGLFAGYRFNDNWSLETGIFFTQKFYWVRRENFDTKKFNAAMPQGMELIEVHGSNCMFQVPVHIRYDFMQKKKSRFFVTAGFSSSLMVKEHNDYTTKYNGNVEKINVNYKENKLYVASSVDLSAGLEYKIKNRLGIRIAPYYQIPLKDIGVGMVPVTTVGLRLGVVRLTH
jgi:hypothetical protein